MQKKIKLIIDTDAANEIDDSFAIAYAFANKNIFDIVGLTICPFKDKKHALSTKDSIIETALELNRILRLIGERRTDLIFKGSEDYYSNLYEKSSPAVEKIISEAKAHEVCIACLGSLTNVAIAIKREPSIQDNLKVVWLGTSHTFHNEFKDTNYSCDKRAFEEVIKSKVRFTIIPNYVGRFIVTSRNDFNEIANNDIGRYFLRKMKNDEYDKFDLGIMTIYNLAPIAYLIHPDWFFCKALSANYLLKEQPKISMGRLVNYVYDMSADGEVWQNFVEKITSYENEITPKQIFFISDTHFGDKRKMKINNTDFASNEERDREIVKRWNNTVSSKDTVYHLGDFGDYNYIKQLNGNVILICGNYEHKDSTLSFNKFKESLIKLGFKDVIKNNMTLDRLYFNRPVFLTHKPSDCKKNMMNFFGHVSSFKPIKRNGINVSVDYHNFTPVSVKEMKKHIEFVERGDKELFLVD